jgi:LysR family transcriptional regulator of abg operon
LRLNQIRDVLAVAELGSLRAAGRHLGVAQPAITRSIRDIEQELGAALFERHSRGVRLTAIGETFVRRARTVNTELRRAREEIDQIKGHSTGEVSVALSIASSIAVMPKAVQAFHRRYPDAVVKISETLFHAIEQEVADGRVDFYIGALDPAARLSKLTVEKLFDNQRFVVARSGHPLLKATSLEALAKARWVRPTLSGRRTEADFEDLFKQVGLPDPKIVIHTRSALLTVLTVTTSDLLTIVPRQWLETPILAPWLEPVRLIGPIEAAPVCIVRQSDTPMTPMAEHLCNLFRRACFHYERKFLQAPHDTNGLLSG